MHLSIGVLVGGGGGSHVGELGRVRRVVVGCPGVGVSLSRVCLGLVVEWCA